MREVSGLSLCICTYKRHELLNDLLRHILEQTIVPQSLIIVDGDPQSGQVLSALQSMDKPHSNCVVFVPSNHPNLSYQRYLGYLAAKELGSSLLLYLDDDLYLSKGSEIEDLLAIFLSAPDYVGATCQILMGDPRKSFIDQPSLLEHLEKKKRISFLIDWFGDAKNTFPGSITPSGNRILPLDSDQPFSQVEWLRGGVMLFRMEALNDSFSADLFALDHIRCGKGEDIFLARRVLRYGKLMYVNTVTVEHPNFDLPKTYPISAYRLAYATAYSRRFLNDHYRIEQTPTMMDRLALFKTYVGNLFIYFIQAFFHPKAHRFWYAFGYMVGALSGLFQKPTAKKLTPDINWWADARQALANRVLIK
jgi:glycosyltransferase involved in cell wall biosynthesis